MYFGRWLVYQRTAIAAKTTRPSCVDFAGEMKAAPDQGPLNFGVSSQAYDTTVWPPKSGWLPKSAEARAVSFEPLRSEFWFDSRTNKDGELAKSVVVIKSSAYYDESQKSGYVAFNIENQGNADVAVSLNIPLDVTTEKFIRPVEYSFREKPTTYKIPITESPELKMSTIIFYSLEDGKASSVAALETAGLYVPAKGKMRFLDEQLWTGH
jgi:hypothetical protein